jgi:hypothetical protein
MKLSKTTLFPLFALIFTAVTAFAFRDKVNPQPASGLSSGTIESPRQYAMVQPAIANGRSGTEALQTSDADSVKADKKDDDEEKEKCGNKKEDDDKDNGQDADNDNDNDNDNDANDGKEEGNDHDHQHQHEHGDHQNNGGQNQQKQ